jgi:hypothetical protein
MSLRVLAVSIRRASRELSCCSSACTAGSPFPFWSAESNRSTIASRCSGGSGTATVQPFPFAGRSHRRNSRGGVPSTQRIRASQSPGPVSGRTGSQRDGAGSGADPRSIFARRRLENTCSRTATRCLHRPSEFRRKSAHSQLPSSGSIRRSNVRYGRTRDPRRRVAYRPNIRPAGRRMI